MMKKEWEFTVQRSRMMHWIFFLIWQKVMQEVP